MNHSGKIISSKYLGGNISAIKHLTAGIVTAMVKCAREGVFTT
ncbi:MAG: hypothetical protein PHX54_01580 [Lentimicrobiaceae bacterium]|nr:hypothetical protein [Lentimicrobiaceae bacterium]